MAGGAVRGGNNVGGYVGPYQIMKAEAYRNQADGQVRVIVTCENHTDERIIMAMANSTWIGTAIRNVFGGRWKCPFYEALKPIVDYGTEQYLDTQSLREELHSTTHEPDY